MTVAVAISSNQGSFQGGVFTLGPVSINSTFASLQVTNVAFGSATFVSTSSPAGAFGVLIEPPSGNTVQLTLKGITGDTGIPLAGNGPVVLQFFNPAIANAVGLASAGAITGLVTLSFF